MHRLGAQLHFEGAAVAGIDGRMDALVAVGLRKCDVVLYFARYGAPVRVDDTERRITVRDAWEYHAQSKNVETAVIHSSSIYTAVAETGLQLYKFGRTTTLAFIEKSFKPSSPYEVIIENRKAGLHTLVLLDVKEDNRYMTISDGIDVLTQLGMDKEIKIVACCQLGGLEQKIRYGTMNELAKDESLLGTPAVIIIPGHLHFKEEEAVRIYEH